MPARCYGKDAAQQVPVAYTQLLPGYQSVSCSVQISLMSRSSRLTSCFDDVMRHFVSPDAVSMAEMARARCCGWTNARCWSVLHRDGYCSTTVLSPSCIGVLWLSFDNSQLKTCGGVQISFANRQSRVCSPDVSNELMPVSSFQNAWFIRHCGQRSLSICGISTHFFTPPSKNEVYTSTTPLPSLSNFKVHVTKNGIICSDSLSFQILASFDTDVTCLAWKGSQSRVLLNQRA